MKRRFMLFYFSLIFLLMSGAVRALAQETPFTHEDVSFTLPEGWVTQEIPSNFEKETVAWLKSEKIAGASILVFCYKGWRQSHSSVRIAGLKTLSATYPKGQEMLKKPTEIETDTGLTAVWEYWKGALDSGGLTVTLESPMGIVGNDNGWILFLGFAPPSGGQQLEADFLKILKTVK